MLKTDVQSLDYGVIMGASYGVPGKVMARKIECGSIHRTLGGASLCLSR